jgi:hypothetical protein
MMLDRCSKSNFGEILVMIVSLSPPGIWHSKLKIVSWTWRRRSSRVPDKLWILNSRSHLLIVADSRVAGNRGDVVGAGSRKAGTEVLIIESPISIL